VLIFLVDKLLTYNKQLKVEHSCSDEIASILGSKLPMLEFLSVYYISLL
jgi:hypothetical protein